jgi:SAM-dependent methyltransferase
MLQENHALSLSAARFVRRYNLVPAVKAINRLMRRLVGYGHKLQFEAEWRIDPTPEWYDHLIFQHWLWHLSRNPMTWERGIFSMLPMKNGSRVLDLCCGGGFFAHQILKRFFGNVLVFENVSRDQMEQRHNLYFMASDAELPFDAGWKNMIRL